jgi:hypothetical protein
MYLSEQSIDNMYVMIGDLSRKDTKKAIKSTEHLDLAWIIPAKLSSTRNPEQGVVIPDRLDLATMKTTINSPMLNISLAELRRRVAAMKTIAIAAGAGAVNCIDTELLKATVVNSGIFDFFNDLPQEIQDEILTIGLPCRIIGASMGHNPNVEMLYYQFAGAQRPAILCVSKKVYAALAHLYKPISLLARGPRLYVNPKLDILQLHTFLDPRPGMYDACTLSAVLGSSSALLNITTLSMNFATWMAHWSLGWSKLNINALQKLEVLNLKIYETLLPGIRQAMKETIEFRKEKAGYYLALYEHGSSSSSGAIAMLEFDGVLEELTGLETYYDVLAEVDCLLEDGLLAGLRLPSIVQIEVEFAPAVIVPAPAVLPVTVDDSVSEE